MSGWEREVAELLAEHGLYVAPDGVGVGPCIECVEGRRVDAVAALMRAVEAAGPGDLPVAAVRREVRGERVDVLVFRMQDVLPRLPRLLRGSA